MILKTFRFSVVVLLLIAGSSFAAPMPLQTIVDYSSKQCSDFIAGDECTACDIPSGWRDLGVGAECPSGYDKVEANVSCTASQSAFCCTTGHSGASGNCNSLVKNDVSKQCSFSSPNCTPSLGWANASSSLCPSDYSWSTDPCTATFCPFAPGIILTALIAGFFSSNQSRTVRRS